MSVFTDEEYALLFLDSFEKLDYKDKKNIIDYLDGGINLFSNFDKCYNFVKDNISLSMANTIKLANTEEYKNHLLTELSQKDIEVITIYTENYPYELFNTPCPPLVLYCRGNTNLLTKENKVAIVGSRKTLPQYMKKAEEISRDLSSNGVVVVTGFAEGGDESAILGALDSGNIISVFANGFNHIYPWKNRNLFNKVVEKGLVITEYRPEIPPIRYNFPVRNRIIAGMTKATLIVSGELKSGARHTANYAFDYNREVFALPYGLNVPSGELCNNIIKNYGKLVENSQDIFDGLMIEFTKDSQELELNENQKAIYEAISDGFDDIDKIYEKTKLPIYLLSSIISEMEIMDIIVKESGNTYKILK